MLLAPNGDKAAKGALCYRENFNENCGYQGRSTDDKEDNE